jgi:hypothetical protein
MVNKVVGLRSEAAAPLPTQPFSLTVDLDHAADRDNVAIRVQAMRLLPGAGGLIEVHPTGDGYFKLKPKPIPIPFGALKGTSDRIELADYPTAGPGEPPVVFPELLVFIAYDDTGDETTGGFHSVVVPISTHPHLLAR